MILTTMAVLEADAAELKKSSLLTTAQREEALLQNAFNRSLLEFLEVKSIEEAEDVVRHLQVRAAETERLKREIAQIEAEMEATRIQQQEMKTSAEHE